MIICEPYQQNNSLYKIYSDKNVLIIKNGYYYDVLITSTDDITGIIESNIGLQPALASKEFIVQNLIGNYKDLTEAEVLKGKQILNQIFSEIENENLYYIIYLIPEWKNNNTYHLNDKVRYNGNIYKVIVNEVQSISPFNQEYYTYIEKPFLYIETWSRTKIPYEKNEQVRIGEHIYTSLINNNIWSPQDFPAAWQLEEGSQV